ncbi:hypothetical protein ACWGTO_32995, partial [Mesorhizobium sp. PL10]
ISYRGSGLVQSDILADGNPSRFPQVRLCSNPPAGFGLIQAIASSCAISVACAPESPDWRSSSR